MARRKKSEGFNFAFIDIMSCGLGAVILVFMLVKHNIDDSDAELERLKDDIKTLESKKEESQQTLVAVTRELQSVLEKESTDRENLDEIKAKLSRKRTSMKQLSAQIENIKSGIKNINITKRADLVDSEQVNEEDYLLGLKMEGNKIAILVDNSASMAAEKLIDIIKIKNSAVQQKKRAKKWLRTQRIVEWMLARVPHASQIIVIAYNERATILGPKVWAKADNATTIPAILTDIKMLVPDGATNLQVGLQMVNKYSPTNLYLITDGLPTKGKSRYKSLNPFASCSSLTGTSRTISGECRVKLFRQTLSESYNLGYRVNTVLLPIEGDPDAINEFWYWTSSSGGLLISPSRHWP